MIRDLHSRAAESALTEYCLANRPTDVLTHALLTSVMELVSARSKLEIRVMFGGVQIVRNVLAKHRSNIDA